MHTSAQSPDTVPPAATSALALRIATPDSTLLEEPIGERPAAVEVKRVAPQPAPPELTDLCRRFIAWVSIRRAAKTAECYKIALNQFCQFAALRELATPAAVDHRAIDEYLTWQLARGRGARTINHRLAALRSFWKWLRRNDLAANDPPGD